MNRNYLPEPLPAGPQAGEWTHPIGPAEVDALAGGSDAVSDTDSLIDGNDARVTAMSLPAMAGYTCSSDRHHFVPMPNVVATDVNSASRNLSAFKCERVIITNERTAKHALYQRN